MDSRCAHIQQAEGSEHGNGKIWTRNYKRHFDVKLRENIDMRGTFSKLRHNRKTSREDVIVCCQKAVTISTRCKWFEVRRKQISVNNF